MRRSRGWAAWIVMLMLLAGRGALAGGPRYVTGPPFFNNQGNPVHWNTASLQYFTDPGGLSASVNHAAADALVQAAAGIWNIPQASINVGQGGALAEHVSGANVYLSASGMVYPADVMSTNSSAIAIAVIYDTDGSVTDTLLGSGASGPPSCRQNAVTETVDGFDPAGYITHAIVVLNGRCTGPVAAQQLQMQYQLERVFGRVLGLAWSQANDNVLTGTPVPTNNQALHWPIMHPLDIICGPYTYQCLPSPFQLRADDVAGMVGLYGVGDRTSAPGKQGSLMGAEAVTGLVSFPSGQGMAGVNVLARRGTVTGSFEGWDESSAVSGTLYRRGGTSPFVPADVSLMGSEGTYDPGATGRYTIGYVPMQSGQTQQDVQVVLEAVNPLYTGVLSVGAYPLATVAPSGSMPPQTVQGAYTDGAIYEDFLVANAAAVCGTGLDGTVSTPAALPATGWWRGTLCGYGHAAYTELMVRPGRSLTVEVTALDEQGYATMVKAMPVMGLYAPGDQSGALPSVAVAAVAFNSEEVGTTMMRAALAQGYGQQGSGPVTALRLGVADQRGDGRPDFAYQARVFYADAVLPAQVDAAGGTVTISGVGFRQGNVVRVNGVGATVTSASATTLVVKLPSAVTAHALGGAAVDLEVTDLSSGADSVMTGAMVYGVVPALGNGIKVVSAPGGMVYVGEVAAAAFAVEVVGPDGSTPVVGDRVTFSASVGSALFGNCHAASCTVVTGQDGVASVLVTAGSAGTVTLQAVDGTLQQSVDIAVLAQDARMTVVSAPPATLPVGVADSVPFSVQVVDASGRNDGGRLITFSVTAGSAAIRGCNGPVCGLAADGSGTAGVYVTPLAAGLVTLTATDGGLQQSVSFTATPYQDTMRVLGVPAVTTLAGGGSSNFSVQLLEGDGQSPDPFEHVIFTASAGAILESCLAARCDVTTNPSGVAQTAIAAAAAGTYTVQAAFGGVTQTISVTFVTNMLQMQVVSGPVGNQLVGQETTVPLTLQLAYTSGAVLTGTLVVIQGPKGGVILDACGNFSCSLYTDAQGRISTGVKTLRTGALTLDAVFGSSVATDTYTGVEPADLVSFVTVPSAAGFLVGSAVSLGVQVLLPDGVTPAAGRSVTFSVTQGGFVFSGSGLVVTDASGRANVTGMATQAGAITVQASEGGGSAAVLLMASDQESLSAVGPVVYVAEGAQVRVTLGVTAMLNGTAAAGLGVLWQSGTGVVVDSGMSVTDGTGLAVMGASVGPLLGPGAATACAWSGVCVGLGVVGVSADVLQVQVVSGGAQAVPVGGVPVPVGAMIWDGAGHAVVGAAVSVYQTVTEVDVACPAEGRCPVGRVLRESATVLVSGADGGVSFTPLTVPGVTAETRVLLTVGTGGVAAANVAVQ